MPRRKPLDSPTSTAYIVRYKQNGHFLAHHFFARSPEQAALGIAGKGKILSVRKVHPSDVIGTIKSMNLQDIIGVERRRTDVILSDTTLDSIVFPKRTGQKGRRKNKRRFTDDTEST